VIDSSQRLRIAVSRGFEAEFLDYFAIVQGSESACRVALQQNCRVIVPDFRRDSLFNVDSRRIMLRANALAVQSTPLISSSGRLLGILSTHYSVPRLRPLARLPYLDKLACRTAELLRTTCIQGPSSAATVAMAIYDGALSHTKTIDMVRHTHCFY
jgi:GAF domain-containing protein